MAKNECVEWQVELDLVKGCAMLLIVWGHVTNALFAGEVVYYFPAKLVGATFVIPILTWVSGYLACDSLKKRTFAQYISARCRRIAVPCIVWNILVWMVINLAKSALNRGKLSPISLGGYWFLWALLISDIILTLEIKFCNNYMQIVLLSIAICILLIVLPIELWYLAWVYPYFIVGYFSSHIIEKMKQCFWTVWVMAVMMYVLVLPFFKDEYLVYYSGSNIWQGKGVLSQLGIDLYRFIIGMLGIIVMYGLCIMVINSITEHNFLMRMIIRLGKHSMGIYLIHTLIVSYILTAVVHNFDFIKKYCQERRDLVAYVFGPIVVLGVLVLVEKIILFINKNWLLKRILLGEYR